ncbi:MAG: hypothetical protein EA426_02975 [Spirochaetaceae bacterium]|nr:MAG: hypothetical protein EA426_02975 [Spirochaetaceae bacterium]
MRRSPRLIILVVASIVFAGLVGCTTTGLRAEDERLFVGANVDVTSEEPYFRTRAVSSGLENIVRPIPNTTLLGFIRPGLWVHDAIGVPEQPGLRSWVYDRFAEEPVLFESEFVAENEGRMRVWLINHGYFDAELESALDERNASVGIEYDVTVRPPYRIGRVALPQHDDEISTAIRAQAAESLIEEGEPYNLERLRQERNRIDRALKDDGFFAFSAEYLLFEAKRDEVTRRVDLELVVQSDTPAEAAHRYTIDSITVFADHTPGAPADPDDTDAVEISPRFRVVAGETRVRPEVFADAVLFRAGDVYSRTNHVRTIDRLMGLALFRFVNIRYEIDRDSHTLDAEIYVTPQSPRVIEGEVQMVSRSDGLVGPGVEVRYTDRNLSSAADQLTVEAKSAAATRIGSGEFALDSWELGLEARYSLPRLILPFDAAGRLGPAMPRTRVALGYSSLIRRDVYRIDRITGSLGYDWTPTAEIRHAFRPVDVSIAMPGALSPTFERFLDDNPDVRRGFDQQFVVMSAYEFLYDARTNDRESGNLVANVRLETAGIVASSIAWLTTGEYPDADDPVEILGVPYAQFLRFDLDLRYFLPVTNRSELAARLVTGVGYPFGNSAVLPRTKQFSVGGPNSMRAFHFGTFGPGAVAPDVADDRNFGRTGDVRIESSLEYRFPLAGIVNGAVFADAGNIWNVPADDQDSERAFRFGTFPAQTAVGAGIGIRIDTPVIVFRLDTAIPLRKPWRPAGDRWVAGEIDVTDRDWRRENVVFNLAIGYPF